MSLKVTFELADADLDHFRRVMRQARSVANDRGSEEVLGAADALLARIEGIEIPEFIRDRLERLRTLSDMLRDAEWKLPEPEATRVLNALAYFCEADDLIPDDVPGLGFLDDAIMVELMSRELKPEMDAYKDFVQYRETEARRLGTAPSELNRSDFLEAREKALLSRMRRRRRAGRGGGSGAKSPFSLF